MDDEKLPLTHHLAELRTRIVRILLAWIICALLAWNFSELIFGYLLDPAVAALSSGERTLQAIAPTEIFFTYLKCAALAGFVLSLPVVFWQIWAFVAPGLYSSERSAIVPFVLVSSLLFGGGAFFGYTMVFPLMFDFFSQFDNEFVESAWTMREVFNSDHPALPGVRHRVRVTRARLLSVDLGDRRRENPAQGEPPTRCSACSWQRRFSRRRIG